MHQEDLLARLLEARKEHNSPDWPKGKEGPLVHVRTNDILRVKPSCWPGTLHDAYHAGRYSNKEGGARYLGRARVLATFRTVACGIRKPGPLYLVCLTSESAAILLEKYDELERIEEPIGDAQAWHSHHHDLA